MVSKSVIDGSLSLFSSAAGRSIPSPVVNGELVLGGDAGTFLGGSGGGVPAGKGRDVIVGDSMLELTD